MSTLGPKSSDTACELVAGASEGSGAEGAPSDVGIRDGGTAEKTLSSDAPVSNEKPDARESAGASEGCSAEGAPSGIGILADGGTVEKTLPGIGPSVSEDFTDCTGCAAGSASDVAQE
ncbi:unnamed protein product [Cylicostephanus goldi]|uniref:Uncharacterized protein n=1 Tax=Cylicostephanus goldi TaxID=71465 RepID=A0A3P6QHA1_CYLGO|nr:unnamed protein product [Cylicostephanus goldi]